ncbi:MAG: GAF domain-containing protein, partial [Anaerolineae bacterium]|nr:GAF domain-containing protein [Anaerolineae bacterium]
QRFKPLVVRDISHLSAENPIRKALEAYHKRSFVEVILRNPETYELIGILGIYFNSPTYLDDSRLEILQTFAKQGALAMTNAQVFLHIDTALNRRVAQLSVLAETGHELASTKSLEELFTLILDRAVIGTNSHAGTLVIADERYNMGLAKLVAHQGYENGVMEHVRLMQTVRSQVFRTGSILIIDNVREHPGYIRLRKQTTSQINLPVLRGRQTIGVLTLEHDAEKAYSSDDEAFLSQLANEASIAVDNIHLLNSLSEGKDRLQVILDSMREGILLIDDDGVVTLANPQVKTLLDLDPNRLIGRTIFDAMTDPALQVAAKLGFTQENLQTQVRELQRGVWQGATEREEFQLFEPQSRHIQRTTVPVGDSAQKAIGMLFVFADVTEERELRQMQEQFSSMIVHDLRGPMTAINASMKLLRDLAQPEDALGKVVLQTTEVSNRAIRKLLNLVNSLLDISKMESGIIALEKEPSHMFHIAESVIKEMQPLATEMEVQLKNVISGKLPAPEIDSDKIERVLYNLVDNAIKFTPSNGAVMLDAHVLDSHMLRVEVRDTGPGVPDEYKTRLFDRYQMMEGRRGRRRGTGLGLTFCKMTIEAHGGQIWIEDNPGGGSVFVFTLPLETAIIQ